ncbi:MAG: flotillin [Verrucomicrobiales bacterium]|nr:flotillin [Verrucomicrobiales bacterium]
MIEPILGISSGIIIGGIVLGALAVFGAFLAMFCLRKVKAGEAGVRTGLGGLQVTKSYMLRMPFVHRWDIMDIQVKKLEVARKGKEGLICQDNIRADIEVAFYVRVDPAESNIKEVAEAVGCERASEIELLRSLFEAKFSDALKAAGKQMDFADLYTKRTEFRNMIINEIGKDLNGYKLEDVAIDYLEQAARDDHDPENVLDAQGIEKINRITAQMEEDTNKRTQQKDVEIKDQNVRAEMEKRELDKQNEEDLAKQTRAVEEAKARENAAAQVEVQKNREVSEKAEIEASQHIKERAVEEERVVMSATYNKDQDLLRLEQEKIESGEQASVERQRRVGLLEQDKEAKIIEAAFGVAESKAGLEAKEKDVTTQRQQRLDVEADMEADRAKRVLMVKATAQAEAALVEEVKQAEATHHAQKEIADKDLYLQVQAAEASRQSAEKKADEVLTISEAEAKASEKRNHAMQQEAEGSAALKSADGLAEAKVIAAKAEAKKVDAEAEEAHGLAEATVIAKQGEASGLAKAAEGEGEAKAVSAKGTAEASALEALRLAEAEGTEKQGLAEALSKTEMAKAIELFNRASQDHEEFRLQLDKDKAVDLAGINVQKDIAEAQARVVGEALKSANIDIVGGENDFFEKVVRSVSHGKSVDRLVNNSQTITDVKNTFFNGDPDYFKTQLRGWIKDLGVSSEDVKNLTISALLTKLISQADDSGLKSVIRQAQSAAKEAGLSDVISSVLLDDKAGK